MWLCSLVWPVKKVLKIERNDVLKDNDTKEHRQVQKEMDAKDHHWVQKDKDAKDRHRVQKDKYVKDRRRVQKDKDAKDRRRVQKDKYIGQGYKIKGIEERRYKRSEAVSEYNEVILNC